MESSSVAEGVVRRREREVEDSRGSCCRGVCAGGVSWAASTRGTLLSVLQLREYYRDLNSTLSFRNFSFSTSKLSFSAFRALYVSLHSFFDSSFHKICLLSVLTTDGVTFAGFHSQIAIARIRPRHQSSPHNNIPHLLPVFSAALPCQSSDHLSSFA